MAAPSSLSRRLILTSSSKLRLLLHHLQNPNPNHLLRSHLLLRSFPIRNPDPNPIPFLKHFSSTTPNPNPNKFQHQEIEGATVERDDSALANETRHLLTSLRRSIYDLSSSLALLSLAHLGLGSYIAYTAYTPHFPGAVSIQGLLAFAFPFSAAFLMRRSLKPISFFQKMEEQGRLQILTLSLQSLKSLKVLSVRMRVVSFCCAFGVSAGALVIVWLR